MSSSDVRSESDGTSSLFLELVVRLANTALICLGHLPHPETGKPALHLDHAKSCIDQLEMLVEKTRGNLTREEDDVLKESLTALRMAFVAAVEQGGSENSAETGSSAPTPAAPTASSATGPESPDDAKRRYVKKYD